MQFRCAPGAVRVYAQASNQPDTLAAARDRELEKLVYACYASFSASLYQQFLFPAGLVIACKLHSTQTFERGAAGVAAPMLAVKSAGAIMTCTLKTKMKN